MSALNVTRTDQIPAAVLGPGMPAVLDGDLLRRVEAALALAADAEEEVDDMHAAEAIHQLADAVRALHEFAIGVISGIHRENIAVSNYPSPMQ